jgi:hypothetical protein
MEQLKGNQMTDIPISAIADVLGGLAKAAKERAERDPAEEISAKNVYDLLLKIADLNSENEVASYLRNQVISFERKSS